LTKMLPFINSFCMVS